MTIDRQTTRTWLRFSLRTLLVLTTAAALYAGLMFSSARKQQAAVAALEAANGHVWYDYQQDADLEINRNARPAEPSWLRNLLGPHFFDSATHLILLTNLDTDNEVLPNLAALKDLRHALVYGSQINDDGLVHLRGCTKLEFLYLGVPITDAGLKHLQALKRLKILHLAGANGRRGETHYPGDDGELADSELYNTKVTLEAVKRLHDRLPFTTIVY